MKHKPSAIEESHMLNSELLTSLQLYYASKVKRRKKQPFILLKKDSKWHCMNTCMTELYSAWRLAAKIVKWQPFLLAMQIFKHAKMEPNQKHWQMQHAAQQAFGFFAEESYWKSNVNLVVTLPWASFLLSAVRQFLGKYIYSFTHCIMKTGISWIKYK